jgi:hypothetical protein
MRRFHEVADVPVIADAGIPIVKSSGSGLLELAHLFHPRMARLRDAVQCCLVGGGRRARRPAAVDLDVVGWP